MLRNVPNLEVSERVGETLTLDLSLLAAVASHGKQEVTWVSRHRVHPLETDLGPWRISFQ